MAYIPKQSSGSTISGRAITHTLFVHPDGDGTNGSSYTTQAQRLKYSIRLQEVGRIIWLFGLKFKRFKI